MELLDILAISGAVSMCLAFVSMILYFTGPRNKNMYLTGMFTLVGISVVLWISYFIILFLDHYNNVQRHIEQTDELLRIVKETNQLVKNSKTD